MTLVEGPFDMVKCDDNATCLLGSHLPVNSLLFQKLIQNKTPPFSSRAVIVPKSIYISIVI